MKEGMDRREFLKLIILASEPKVDEKVSTLASEPK